MDAGYLRKDNNGQRHLTDEQFTELLMGSRPAWVQAHLVECSACREEAERVSGAIGDFAEQSLLWAEQRAVARPMRVAEREPAWAWLLRPQAWAVGAMAIALAVGIGMTMHRDHTQPVQQATATAPADATKTQVATVQPVAAKVQAEAKAGRATLKADNALLTAIDGELRADESTPASLYGLEATSYKTGTKSVKRTSN
jgi:predicted anti-sigma-YlaC factor YlaD